MYITIAGGHGNIAQLLYPILREKGHTARGIIRKNEQTDRLRELNAEPVVCDIEQMDDLSDAVGPADAVIFAAGAGPGSGTARKWTVDRDGALKLIHAAKKNGINRYLMISAMGLDTPRGSEVFQVYQKAKAEADEALRESGLDYTILKPGRLTDEPGTGQVTLGKNLERDEIPRKDVARVLAELLEEPATAGLTLDVVAGFTPVSLAVREVKS